MSRLVLMLARFCLSAWVGAAVMFVIVGVREIRAPQFDSATRDVLVLLRFPPYYACGFGALAVAAACLVLRLCWGPRRRATWAACLLTVTALGLMTWDYYRVYRPLAAMVSPPGKPRPAEFRFLHQQSEIINALQVGCALAAAAVVCGSEASGRVRD